MTALLPGLRDLWRRMSLADVLALILLALGSFAFGFELSGRAFNFLKFLAALALLYLLVRFISWWRARLLWSLRNRLIVAYVFIAVVPILLIVTLVFLAGRIVYSQLGAYLLYEDINSRVAMIEDIAEHIAAAHSSPLGGARPQDSEAILASQSHTVHDRELPGLTISFSDDDSMLRKIAPGKTHFAGLLQQEDSLTLTSVRVMREPAGTRVVTLRVPVNPPFLSYIAQDLGALQLNLMERSDAPSTAIYASGGVTYRNGATIVARNRSLQPANFLIDPPINVVSRIDAVFLSRSGNVELSRPVFAVFSARPSRLNARIFSSLGELRDSYLLLFVLVGGVFLAIELAALVTGVVMTRRITKAVSDLYRATQYVQSGDLSHRVRIDRRDQLGVLGESFNQMTGSISGLIEEQNQRQRLENEIAIAREVQDQLFPKNLPSVPGVEIEAICKAARSVSGDYYDFIQLSDTHVAIAIADISGKGISAALLMASLQAALRSQLLTDGSQCLSTSELVSRLNKHLVRNTGDDRFATFFIGVYDCAGRTLRYTNAGHLPSFLIGGGEAVKLEAGGMVLGIVDDYVYEEGKLAVPPDSLLIGYSDGLIEPENVYGEEFGIRRLLEAAMRVQNSPPLAVAQSLMSSAEEWAGTPEQADDMTVIVGRFT